MFGDKKQMKTHENMQLLVDFKKIHIQNIVKKEYLHLLVKITASQKKS